MVKLSVKIAFSIWTVLVVTGFVVSLVALINSNIDFDVWCFASTGVGILGLASLVLAILTTLAWCDVE